MSTPAVQKPKDLFLLEGINILTFNKDFTQVALSKKDNVIYIYSVPNLMKTDTWKLLTILKNHYQYISGLDQCPATNRILSCSYDKTSFVWDLVDKKWTSSNVVATTKLGYLCCKWNKRGDKFCEGTSAKQLFIGYYNTETKWWMGVNIKHHKSSVVICEIDPTSLFVIYGSTDLRIHVSSCYLPEIDDNFLKEDTKHLAKPFGELIYEFKENSWINSATWLPNGFWGLVASQDAIISIVNLGEQKTEQIRCKHSPVIMIIPKNDNSFYAVCYDRNIIEYEKKGDKWEIKKSITGKKEGDSKARTSIGNVSAALEKFNQMNLQNKQNLAVTTKQASHLHKSQISSITIKDKDIITTDYSGFVKYLKL